MTDTVDKIVIQAETSGVDQATSDVQGLSKAMDGVTVASANVEKSTGSIDSKFASLERRFSTTAGQMSQFEKVQQQVNTAVAANPALQDRGNAVLAVAEQRYGGVNQALQKQRDALAQVAATQKAITQSTGIGIVSDSASRGSDIAAYGKQLDDLRAKYNPLFAAGQQYKATLTEINTAAKVGALTETERAAAVMNTKVAFVEQVNTLTNANGLYDLNAKAVKASADAHEKLSTQGQAAFHFARSFTEQTMLGVPPLQAFTAGINHLTYATTGEGGLTGAFKEVGGFIGNMLTPMRLAVGGTVALAAAGLYLANSWSESGAQTQRAVIGIGAATGSTAADLNNFAKTNSSATGLTIGEARNAAIEFTKTGDIAVKNLKGVGDAVHGYAVLTGKDATEATKDLAASLSGDLVKGAEELNKTYMAFDASALDYIQTLQTTGERAKAVQFIVDSIAPANLKANDSVGILTKGYQALAGAMSLIKNGPPAVVSGGTPQDRLQQAKTTRQTAGTSYSGQLSGGFGSDILGGADAVPIVNSLDDAIKTAQKDVENFGGIGKEAFTKLSVEAKNATDKIFPQIEQIRQLQVELDKLQEAKSKGAADPNVDAAVTAYQNQINLLQQGLAQTDAYNVNVKKISQSWGNVDTATALALDAAENQLPVLEAVGNGAKMAAKYTADFNSYLDQGKTSIEAQALAESNLVAAQAQVNSSAQQTLASLRDQYAVASSYTAQQQITAQGQATYNQLVREGVDAVNAEAVATQQVSNARAQVYVQMEKAVQASKDQLDLYATQGTSAQASVKAAIAYRNAINAGADSTQAGIIATNTATLATAQWAEQAQRLAQAYEDAARAARDAQFSDPGGSFGNFTLKGTSNTSTSPAGFQIQQLYKQISNFTAKSVSDLVDSNVASGGLDSALAYAKSLQPSAQQLATIYVPGVTTGPVPFSQFGLSDITTKQAVSQSDIVSAVSQLYDLKIAQAGNDNSAKAGIYNDELAYFQGQPQSVATLQKISELQNSIQQLKTSTDNLTSVNQDLLSPYYSQDPRTSHIGFRSQGMATGGEFTVPGGYSANDNMLAQIPVASGEIVSVRRPGQSLGSNTQQITFGDIHITVQGAGNQANANAIGRTVYQAMQRQASQLAMANR